MSDGSATASSALLCSAARGRHQTAAFHLHDVTAVHYVPRARVHSEEKNTRRTRQRRLCRISFNTCSRAACDRKSSQREGSGGRRDPDAILKSLSLKETTPLDCGLR
ncbi:hypothetical protein OJAV_G00116620 [Oryzias javanicus]|uniref:Uncharacterized protein n=1 Tax=Oryzias javanicus TaxID=123683 RepID=A0A437CRF2_ORYJA|nr:hypothetical protein OJAV_G00116620 [Oryzias javanicus]